jgi:Zn-finger nucleic acid-binding protein
MDEHLYGGGGNVDMDSCESCSVLWLDRGELSRMVAAPDRDPRDLGTSASDMLEMDSARTGFN